MGLTRPDVKKLLYHNVHALLWPRRDGTAVQRGPHPQVAVLANIDPGLDVAVEQARVVDARPPVD